MPECHICFREGNHACPSCQQTLCEDCYESAEYGALESNRELRCFICSSGQTPFSEKWLEDRESERKREKGLFSRDKAASQFENLINSEGVQELIKTIQQFRRIMGLMAMTAPPSVIIHDTLSLSRGLERLASLTSTDFLKTILDTPEGSIDDIEDHIKKIICRLLNLPPEIIEQEWERKKTR